MIGKIFLNRDRRRFKELEKCALVVSRNLGSIKIGFLYLAHRLGGKKKSRLLSGRHSNEMRRTFGRMGCKLAKEEIGKAGTWALGLGKEAARWTLRNRSVTALLRLISRSLKCVRARRA